MSFVTYTATFAIGLSSSTGILQAPSPATATGTGIPSSIPRVITPPGGLPDQVPGSTLAQIGLLYSLNYNFVLKHSLSQQQIFKYIPKGIAYGINGSEADVIVQTLRADDTTNELGYVTTLVFFYVPSDQVDVLALHLHDRDSIIYNNSDLSVKTLMDYINPFLPIRGDDSSDQVSTRPSSTPGSSTSVSPASSSLSSHQKISIGVAVPIAVIALLCLGAFWWRRRRRNTDLPPMAEKDIDEKRHEMAPEARRFELQEHEYELELPTGEENQRRGLQRRQELHGGEFLQELEVPEAL